MKSRLPWRAHNPTGWAESVAGLSPVEEWGLLRLLDQQWISGALPAEPAELLGLLRFLGLDARLQRHLRIAELMRYFPLLPGQALRRANPELMEERERAINRMKSLADRNRKAALARWEKDEA